jgi:hypothetical protein
MLGAVVKIRIVEGIGNAWKLMQIARKKHRHPTERVVYVLVRTQEGHALRNA